MVHRIGGIDVDNPIAFSDISLKPKGFRPAASTSSGYDAMAYSRIRHALPARRLRPLGPPGDRADGDPGQGARQRRRSRGSSSSGVLDAMSHMSTNLPPAELFELAQVLAQVDPSKVRSCVVQGGIGTSSGGASIVLPYVYQARDMGDQIRKDATLSHCG